MGDNERGEHIRGYYEILYKKRLDNLLGIENFLTENVVSSEWVGRRKLTELEKNSLENEITMEELEKSLEESNFHSTSCWDGISFKVIRKYWNVLNVVMLKMARETFVRGELIETFKLGLIKLIPKKGDARKVSEWRPITLLSCGYKIISGLVSNRLEKFLMKIIGRAQKGFLKQKNIHSCTLNILGNIAESWERREEVEVLCVDFSKAFDSIEHEVIRSSLKFFNFGDNMVNMVMTILTDRKARVILDGSYSETLQIQRGTPQGDRASPFIFIIVMEILLIKLVSKDGEGINGPNYIHEWLNGIDIESTTAEAYADDLTIIFKMCQEGVV